MKKIILILTITYLALSCNSDEDNTDQNNNPNNQEIIINYNSQLQYGSVTDGDGNTYKTIKIGSQTWMANNLRTTKYRNGDPIPKVISTQSWDNTISGAYISYENNTQPNFIQSYGLLYNWHAINDPRNIAPPGWHVPTEQEWQTLINTLGGANLAGGKLKEIETSTWTTPNTGASNSSGFTALPGGLRYNNINLGRFDVLNRTGLFWSASSYDTTNAYFLAVYHDSELSNIFNCNKGYGLSVRCIKD